MGENGKIAELWSKARLPNSSTIIIHIIVHNCETRNSKGLIFLPILSMIHYLEILNY